MAQYPCATGGHRYREAQQSIYPALVSGVDRYGRKLRYCPDHFREVMDTVSNTLWDANLEYTETLCLVCENEDPNTAVFVTAYAKGQDRVDFFGRMHEACGHLWLASLERPL